MLIACIIISHFSAKCELVRRPELRGKAAIVYRDEEARPVVVDSSPEAGIRYGTPLSIAFSRFPDAVMIKADDALYDAEWASLESNLSGVSDRVESASRGCVYVAMDGLQAMYGGEENLLSALLDAVPEEFVARMGIASGKFPSYCAAFTARHLSPVRLPADPGSAKRFMAPMPVSLLPFSIGSLELLRDFGIWSIGNLASQPVSALQSQLGAEGRNAWELANGLDRSPVMSVAHAEVIRERLQFPWPAASMDAFSFGFRTLLDQAFASPALRGRAVGKMAVTCEVADAERWSFDRVFKEPLISPDRGYAAAMTVIETACQRGDSPIQGPTESMSVALSHLGPPRAEQGGLWRESAEGDLNNALRQMAGKIDLPAIKTVVDVEPWSRIPERRQALVQLSSH